MRFRVTQDGLGCFRLLDVRVLCARGEWAIAGCFISQSIQHRPSTKLSGGSLF
jgi:hypothetical protein